MARLPNRRNNWAAMGAYSQVPVGQKARDDMVVNTDGRGYVFTISEWDMMKRFLILGSTGGTYYADEKKVTMDNYANLKSALDKDYNKYLNMIKDVSVSGKAFKNDPAIFALAVALNCGNAVVQKMASKLINDVARTGTHIFTLMEFSQRIREHENRGKWSRSLKSGLASWYTKKEDRELAYQMLKYQSRDGWSHKDMLRLLHVQPKSDFQALLYAWSVGKASYAQIQGRDGWVLTKPVMENGKIVKDENGNVIIETIDITEQWRAQKELNQIGAFERAIKADKKEVIKLIKDYRLTREMIPTQFQNDPEVQEVMLKDMPMTALIRNLGNMSKSGFLVSHNFDVVKQVTDKITSMDALRKARIHPISILIAMKQYEAGHGFRGHGEWTVVPDVVSALNKAFYMAFETCEPANKRFHIAVDISPSMYSSAAGATNMTAYEVAGAFSTVIHRIEQKSIVSCFNARFSQCKFGRDASLKQVLDELHSHYSNWSSTNISLPISWSMDNKAEFDVFMIITDNEVNTGRHVYRVLEEYRRKFVKDAKLIVLATTPTKFSVADPNDNNMLDIAGFSSDVPDVVTGFARGDF